MASREASEGIPIATEADEAEDRWGLEAEEKRKRGTVATKGEVVRLVSSINIRVCKYLLNNSCTNKPVHVSYTGHT